jgi:hypothetical protein
MADAAIIEVVRRYLHNLGGQGIPAHMGIIFGSYAGGHPDEWSDIDLLVVSSAFDGTFSRDAIDSLWYVAARTDSRIEPIPCGERQWTEDNVTPIIEIARREGVQVVPDGNAGGEMA